MRQGALFPGAMKVSPASPRVGVVGALEVPLSALQVSVAARQVAEPPPLRFDGGDLVVVPTLRQVPALVAVATLGDVAVAAAIVALLATADSADRPDLEAGRTADELRLRGEVTATAGGHRHRAIARAAPTTAATDREDHGDPGAGARRRNGGDYDENDWHRPHFGHLFQRCWN